MVEGHAARNNWKEPLRDKTNFAPESKGIPSGVINNQHLKFSIATASALGKFCYKGRLRIVFKLFIYP